MPPTMPPASREPAAADALDKLDEPALLRELARGSFEAGERLTQHYGARTDRTRDTLAVRKQQAMIRLGDPTSLRALYEASVADGNLVYARAIDHVLAVADGSAAFPAAPSLAAQVAAPDIAAALLFRRIADSPVHEALALVLETGLYRRDAAHYQLIGVPRLPPGGPTALGELFGVVARALGQVRTPLYHVHAATPPGAKIALLHAPTVILSGEVRDESPEVLHFLGASLAGALPEHALVNALGQETIRTLLEALLAAFGPVTDAQEHRPEATHLGQTLWQVVPPRADRRLRELCVKPSLFTYESALAASRQAMRRTGLFVSGSLATAITLVGYELSIPGADQLDAPGSLAKLCEQHAAIADLVRLALRPEFAEARWQPGGSAADRRRDEASRTRAGA